MSTKRQQIVDALKVRIATIMEGVTVTSGGESYTYATDIGLNVEVWRKESMGLDDPWFVNLRDTVAKADAPEGSEVGRKLHRLTVHVDLVAKDDLAPELIRSAMADICACIGVDPRLGGLCRWIDIEEESLDVYQAAELLSGTTVTLSVTYKTDLWRM